MRVGHQGRWRARFGRRAVLADVEPDYVSMVEQRLGIRRLTVPATVLRALDRT